MDGSGDDEDDQRDDEDEGDEPPEPPPEPEDPSDDSPRITRQELEAFLVLPETRRLGMALARLKVPEQEAEGIFSDARTDALRTKQLPRAKSVQSWFSTVCRRAIARWHRKRARRKKHEGPMPVAAAVLDEAGLPIEDPGDAVVDIDASTDPTRENPVHEGMLMRRWMSGASCCANALSGGSTGGVPSTHVPGASIGGPGAPAGRPCASAGLRRGVASGSGGGSVSSTLEALGAMTATLSGACSPAPSVGAVTTGPLVAHATTAGMVPTRIDSVRRGPLITRSYRHVTLTAS